jgi:predicted TIM-barrel enzyme
MLYLAQLNIPDLFETSTGKEALIEDIKIAHENTNLPVLNGSGISRESIKKYWDLPDEFIIGFSTKENGKWSNDISEDRLKSFVNKVKELREG